MKLMYPNKNCTIQYAVEELKKYLNKILKNNSIDIINKEKYTKKESVTIWVGPETFFPEVSFPEVENEVVDDIVYAKTKGKSGIISGNNSRSILLSVYKFLREIGFRWVRPGKDGEIIPNINDFSNTKVEFLDQPSSRHRGICIEGSNSYEHIKDIIEWAPKLGFNSYFIQFQNAYTFFYSWYGRGDGVWEQPLKFSPDRAYNLTKRIVKEIKKRDLLYHAVGHGWTCAALDVPTLGWISFETQISEDKKQILPLINNERKIYNQTPLNTNLCYSNPEARTFMVKEVVKYLKKHPEVDFLHFWLADGFNNQCECEKCQQKLPSDFYVMMLNELDDSLSKQEIDTRIVFISYNDTFWAPMENYINNSDRFLLMFAPFNRTFSKGYKYNKIPTYKRNQIDFKSEIGNNVSFLEEWKKAFTGEKFIFDYHLRKDYLRDPGTFKIARRLYEDIEELENMDLRGMMSCQDQRIFFPTGLAMNVLGRTLWDCELEFEDIVEEYFKSAFGSKGDKCKKNLIKLSQLFDPEYLRQEKPQISEKKAEQFDKIIDIMEQFNDLIENNLSLSNRGQTKSWEYLKHFNIIYKKLAKMLKSRAKGNKKNERKYWQSFKKSIQNRRADIHKVFNINNLEVISPDHDYSRNFEINLPEN